MLSSHVSQREMGRGCRTLHGAEAPAFPAPATPSAPPSQQEGGPKLGPVCVGVSSRSQPRAPLRSWCRMLLSPSPVSAFSLLLSKVSLLFFTDYSPSLQSVHFWPQTRRRSGCCHGAFGQTATSCLTSKSEVPGKCFRHSPRSPFVVRHRFK